MRAIAAPAPHRAAKHQVMSAPAVVRAVAVRTQGAAEFGSGEGGHLIGHPHPVQFRLEGRQRLAQFAQQGGMVVAQAGVVVIAVLGHEEHLAARAQRLARGDDGPRCAAARQRRIDAGEAGRRRHGGQRIAQARVRGDRAQGDGRQLAFHQVRAWRGDQIAQQRGAGFGAVEPVAQQVDGGRSLRTDAIAGGMAAGQQHRVAAGGDARHARCGRAGQQQIGQASGPAGRRAFRRQRLPVRLLVVVREQRAAARLFRPHSRPCWWARPADAQRHGQAPARVQGCQRRQRRASAKRMPFASGPLPRMVACSDSRGSAMSRAAA